MNRGQAIEHLHNIVSMGMDYPLSQLEMWIGQACDPIISHSPNLGLNMEICDLINKNLKTYPRDAAFAIVKHINSSSSASALAIPLLDQCAKNCGYPFHLVMSSKEFLNELVRKFPDHPRHLSLTHRKILDLLAEWNIIYAQKSRYREDFKNIYEMCRLLEYKGYQFPRVDESIAMDPDVELKTEEQLENEDMKNQGTKLEELIRKATPAALAEANDMMKLMSGYDTSKKRDYKKEVNAELERIESRTILLNDMLNQKSPEDIRRRPDPAVAKLVSSSKVAQIRLQKFIADNEDEKRLGVLLELNDLINTVLQKYNDLQAGKTVAKNSLDRKSGVAAGASNSVKEESPGLINLIDFNEEDHMAAVIPSTTTSEMPFDLFGSPPRAGAQTQSDMGDINSLQFGGNNMMSTSFAQPMMHNNSNFMQQSDQFGHQNLQQIPLMNFGQQQQPPRSDSASPPRPSNSNSEPFRDLFSNFSAPVFSAAGPLAFSTASPPPFSTATPPPLSITQQGKQNSPASFSTAILPSLSTASPPPQQGKQNMDLLGMFEPETQPKSNTIMPPSLAKESKRELLIFNKNGLQIKLAMQSPSNIPQIYAQASFHNITPVQFSELNFQISVPKSMNVQMEPISSSILAPFNQSPAFQKIFISNPSREPLRLRFKICYSLNGAQVEEIEQFSA